MLKNGNRKEIKASIKMIHLNQKNYKYNKKRGALSINSIEHIAGINE
jgi:hypothetical protein